MKIIIIINYKYNYMKSITNILYEIIRITTCINKDNNKHIYISKQIYL